MAIEFELPDTGEGINEGKFLEWLVEEGEEVDEDQIIAEVETDKAVVDVPAPAHGKIKELKAKPGDTVDVGEVIMTMDAGKSGDETEKTGEDEPEAEGEEGQKAEDAEEKDLEPEKADYSSGDVLALPKVRKLAEEKGVDLEALDIDGRIREEDVLDAAGSDEDEELRERAEVPEDVAATPAVRKLAREKGVGLEKVEGSGRGGKILRDDILEAAGGQKQQGVKTSEEGVVREPLEGVRKVVAEKMEESKFTAPHVTHIEKADITRLVELREKVKEEVEPHLTYLPFIAKAASIGLKKYPLLNAELDEENQEIVKKKDYDFNIAVDTERGLMSPIVEEVDEKSIVELATGIKNKAESARENELSPEELRVGTFTLTNIGSIGGEAFTPIINYPQVAILGIGEIQETAEVVDGSIEPRMTVKLSLSYDHRVIDGAEAARFMNEVVENLENPGEMLLEL